MNFKNLAIFLLLIFTLSCEHEDVQVPVIYKNYSPLLEKLMIDGEDFNVYTYNEVSLIREEENKYTYTLHHYNQLNQLILSEYYVDSRIFSSSGLLLDSALKRTVWVSPENTPREMFKIYEYTPEGKLLRITINRSTGYSEYSSFAYNPAGRICRQNFYYMDHLDGYTDYFYDTLGNLIQQKRYFVSVSGDFILSLMTEYEYDDKNNPYHSFKSLLIPGIYTNRNNILKETYTLYDELKPFDPVQVNESTYEYDPAGYPVRKDGVVEYKYY